MRYSEQGLRVQLGLRALWSDFEHQRLQLILSFDVNSLEVNRNNKRFKANHQELPKIELEIPPFLPKTVRALPHLDNLYLTTSLVISLRPNRPQKSKKANATVSRVPGKTQQN